MIGWIATVVLALVIARIVWVEVKCGRRTKSQLADVNGQIEDIKRSATMRYREKFGRDPTAPFTTVNVPDVSSSKKA